MYIYINDIKTKQWIYQAVSVDNVDKTVDNVDKIKIKPINTLLFSREVLDGKYR